MSLENLAKIGQLVEHETDRNQVRKMMEAAERFVADARQATISAETRFDAAYKACLQYAMVALHANSYRPPKSKPGHHQTIIQSLVHSVGLDNDQRLLLDTFRVKRNAVDYTGDLIDEGSVTECIEASVKLKKKLVSWLTANRPDLLS